MSTQHASDAEHLASLGYKSEFKREMTLWQNFSLGFTYLSPVVGVYSLFALALAAGGPPMFWWIAICGIGQFLVALVFSEIVSQYPIAGGVYPWARRLWGKGYAWMTGWVYGFALIATIASVTYGVGPFVAGLLGMESSQNLTIIIAIALIAIVTLINFGGTKLLGQVAFFGFVAEIVGAVIVGVVLLVNHREQSFGVVFDTSFVTGGGTSYTTAFMGAALIGLYLYYGFEACGDVAEEVENPGIVIPKAMRMTLYIGGAASLFITYALILSVADIGAVVSGENADPIGQSLAEAFGATGSKAILAIVSISFFSCALSLQAAASRLIYSYARDGMIFAQKSLSKMNASTGIAPVALIASAVLPVLFVLTDLFLPGGIYRLVAFASVGIYIAFQMVVLAALRARMNGWKPAGKWSMGAAGMTVNLLALVYGVFAIYLMLKSYGIPDGTFVDNYIVLVEVLIVIGVGIVYMLVSGAHKKSNAPAGDAFSK
jgi:amino acid transporter